MPSKDGFTNTEGNYKMSTYQLQSAEMIADHYAELRFLKSLPGYHEAHDARLAADTAAFHHEQRLRYIRRYLRERAARKTK